MSFENLSDQHVPKCPEIFLDTSIHCSRHKGNIFVERIDSVFSLFKWRSTSTYTKLEYGNVVLGQAEYFLDLLDKHNSLEKAVSWVAHVLSSKSHDQKRTWAFSLLTKYTGGNDKEATERARRGLSRLLKYGMKFVDETCDRPLCDGTKCFWAKTGVQQRSDGRYVWKSPICKRTKKRCRIDEFFIDNIEDFKRIRDMIESLPEENKTPQLRNFWDVINRAETDPSILLDYSTGCRLLADAIIAVDGKEYRCIFSQNQKESEVLAPLFDQDFYYLPPNPDKGVLVQRTFPSD